MGVNKVEWLEAERQNKKQLLQILLTSPVFAHVTRQYVLTLFAMVEDIAILNFAMGNCFSTELFFLCSCLFLIRQPSSVASLF